MMKKNKKKMENDDGPTSCGYRLYPEKAERNSKGTMYAPVYA